ncbi:MAG: sulfate adenylyltransferase subunit CysD [Candidatus Bathyarchaeota archaeon]|jgi:sulfate adenylyltransferase subunit 2
MNTEELVAKSVYILREAKANFKNPVILWSTGKDSTLSLSLCKEAFFGQVPFPVMHIDTGWKFKQMYEFRDKIAKDWNLDLIVEKSEMAGKLHPSKVSHQKCCQTLKTNALRDAIENHGFDAVIVSIRRDEHPIRNIERVASPRDRNFLWKLLRKKKKDEKGDAPYESLQQVELGFSLQTDFGEDCHHIRIHPILHWDEIDVWKYIQKRGIPVNPMYFAKDGRRYRSLGCHPCTKPIESSASNIDEILEELKTTKIAERSGRSQDKDSEQVMRKLRAMGYM